MKEKILIVEDKHPDIFDIPLKENGFETKLCDSFTSFKKVYRQYNPDIIVLDLKLKNGECGIDVLKHLEDEKDLRPEIIIVSGEASRSEIAEVMKYSPAEFYDKTDYNEDKFIFEVKNALKIREQKLRIIELEDSVYNLKKENKNIMPFIGESKSVKEIKDRIEKLKNNDSDIMIVGKTGTGKEIVANNIHYFSARYEENFIRINCNAIPESLIEKELFGSEKGAYTGSDKLYKGYFENAGKGTIFLDEIQCLDKNTQAKLLRIIENKEFYRVGQSDPVKLKARIIFGTNAEPETLVKEDKMREDFYYRIDSCIRFDLPELKRRDDDLLLLMDYFIRQENEESPLKHELLYDLNSIKPELFGYPWNGNVRELKNFCKRLVINADNKSIENDDIVTLLQVKSGNSMNFKDKPGSEITPLLTIPTYKEAVEEFEKLYFTHRMKINNNNKSQTADEMKYDRTALHKKLKKLRIDS